MREKFKKALTAVPIVGLLSGGLPPDNALADQVKPIEQTGTATFQKPISELAQEIKDAQRTGLQVQASSRITNTSEVSSSQLEEVLAAYTPFPWKQDIIRNSPQIQKLLLSTPDTPETKESLSVGVVEEIGTPFTIGSYPNYTAGIERDGKKIVFAACYYPGELDEINITDRTVIKRSAGPNTNPLDVAYDTRRDRIVVASADWQAKVVVLDKNGAILKTLPLAPLTGQGESNGGVQGVTIDRDGNYWAAVAYFGQPDKGVVVKVDGETHATTIIKDAGMNNPNGIITSEEGTTIYALSDNGFAQEFDLNGNLKRTIPTLGRGYRGIVHGDFLYVISWGEDGKAVRINLKTDERMEFPTAILGNSIQVDAFGLVWGAGDGIGRTGSVSVGTTGGKLIERKSFGREANGLASVSGDIFFVTYDNKLHNVRGETAAEPLIQLAPGWDLRGLYAENLAPYTAQSLIDEFKAQGLDAAQIARWENGRWESVLANFAGNDFPIEQGKGYFIKTKGGAWRPGARVPLSLVSTVAR